MYLSCSLFSNHNSQKLWVSDLQYDGVCVAEDFYYLTGSFSYSISLSTFLHSKLKTIHHIHSLAAEICLYFSCKTADFKSAFYYEVFTDRRQVCSRGLHHTANYWQDAAALNQLSFLNRTSTSEVRLLLNSRFKSQISTEVEVSYLESTLFISLFF